MNIVFDFDSTLIAAESLETAIELAIKSLPNEQKAIFLNKIEEITNLGMEGKIPLKESIKKRMELAKITKKNLKEAAEICAIKITPGMKDLIENLLKKSINIYIVSGGPQTCVYRVAKELNIPKKNVQAVEFVFDGEIFNFEKSKIDSKKIEAVKSFKLKPEDSIAVGDGATDLEIWEKGIVKYFIGYCEFAERKKILEAAPLIARNTNELEKHLLNIFKIIHS